MQRTGWGPAPPQKRAVSGFTLFMVFLLGACCLTGMVAKRMKDRDDEAARVAEARARARRERFERERFAAMAPEEHLASARAVLSSTATLDEATLARARRDLDAVPGDGGASRELAELNALHERRTRQLADQNARERAAAERELRRREAACAPRRAHLRLLDEAGSPDDVRHSVMGDECEILSFEGSGCGPEALWLYGYSMRRELRRARFASLRCVNTITGTTWTQGLPVPHRYVPPAEPVAPSVGATTGAPRCRRGCPCGNSCIPCRRRCRL